jgi:hypothetical protein
MKYLGVILAFFIVCTCTISALPTTGIATGVNSNGFNSTATGVTGTEVWGMWGDAPGYENWMAPPVPAVAGTGVVSFIGAPLFGQEIVYFQVCDSTGCGNEQPVTITAVTPMPTTTHGQLLKNITNSRFNPLVISESMKSALTVVAPFTIVIGIALFFYVIGIWMRTRSVRLIAILGILIAPFVMLSGQGLYLGVPSMGILIAKGLLAAGLAGILFAFMRK